MKPTQREQLRKALVALRKKALAKAPAKIEPLRADETQVGTSDEDAQALGEMLQVLASQRNKGQAEEVARIDRALQRLAQAPDEFGLCQECGDEIPLPRLKLVPWATLCADCQKERDPRRGGVRRKVTDYT